MTIFVCFLFVYLLIPNTVIVILIIKPTYKEYKTSLNNNTVKGSKGTPMRFYLGYKITVFLVDIIRQS